MFDNKSVLITGGTGSFGKRFVRRILDDYPTVRRIVIFSRDELKQFEMRSLFSADELEKIRFFLGDIRDKSRMVRALDGVDTVIHAAALKQVPAAEYNPFEFIQTNVIGAQNIIEACLDTGVTRVAALSTDKAAAPINLYGATKLCSDKLFAAANNMVGDRDLIFSVVRYGNVMGSRGSVIPFFMKKAVEGKLPITDARMTRFNISLDEGVDLVFKALSQAKHGEIFVPKIPSYRILDIAEAVAPGVETEIVGIRPGEKIHEEMITVSDGPNTVDMGEHFVILPSGGKYTREQYIQQFGGEKVPPGFSYNSADNEEFLTPEALRILIDHNVNI